MAGSDIGFWLTKKYAVMQQQADAASRLANSQAAHVDAETGELPANARATRAATYGQADASYGAGAANRAHAGLLTVNAGLAPALAGAEVNQRNAAADLAGSQASTERYGITPNQLLDSLAKTRLGQPAGGSGASVGASSPYVRNLTTPVTSLPMDSAPAAAPSFSTPDIPHFAGGTGDVEATAMAHHSAAIAHYGARLGYKSAPPAPAMLPGHASGTSDFQGTPGFSSTHGTITDRETGATIGTPGVSGSPGHALAIPAGMTTDNGFQQVAGYAAGTNDLQGGGMPDVGNFKKGATAVPGRGDGTKDTVKAALAPGEAVLNKAAAEHLGRDTIDLLNAAGAQKMGLSQQPNVPNAVPDTGAKPGFKKGTSDVPPAGKPTGAAAAPAMAAKQSDPRAEAGHAQKAPSAKAPPAKANKGDATKGDRVGAAPPGKGAAAPKAAAAPKDAGKKPAGGVSPQMIAALAGMMGGGGMPPAPMAPPAMPQQQLPPR